jgi:RasGEF domain
MINDSISPTSINSTSLIPSPPLFAKIQEGQLILSTGQVYRITKLTIQGQVFDLSKALTPQQKESIEAIVNKVFSQIKDPELLKSNLKSISVKPTLTPVGHSHSVEVMSTTHKEILNSSDFIPLFATVTQAFKKFISTDENSMRKSVPSLKSPLTNSQVPSSKASDTRLVQSNVMHLSQRAKEVADYLKNYAKVFLEKSKTTFLGKLFLPLKDKLTEIYKKKDNSQNIKVELQPLKATVEEQSTPLLSMHVEKDGAEAQNTVDLVDSSIQKGGAEKTEQKKGNNPSSQPLSLADYHALLKKMDQQDHMVLRRKKNASHTIQLVKGKINKSLLFLDKRSKTALKEIIQATQAHSSSDPLASLELLNKLRSSTWGKQALKFSPNLNTRFKIAYKANLTQCLNFSRQQFTELFTNVTSTEMLKSGSVAGTPEYKEECPNLSKLIEMTNAINYNVESTILAKPSLKERAHTMAMYIRLASQAYDQGDFATAKSIFSGLNQSSITRLKNTKNNLPLSVKALLTDLEAKMGNISADQAPKDREWLLEQKFNLPVLPFIGDAFLTPLTMGVEKRKNFESSVKDFTIANKCIDKLKDKLLNKHIEELETKIKTLQEQSQSIAKQTKESFKLTFQIKDLEAELKEALKTQLLMDHFNQLTQENNFLNQTSDSLKEKTNGFVTNLKTKLSDLEKEHQEKLKQAKENNIPLEKSTLNNYAQVLEKLNLEIEVASDWIKVINNTSTELENSSVDSSKLLNLIYQRNLNSLKSFELGVKDKQKELDKIIQDFENLMKPIKDNSVESSGTPKASNWFHENKVSGLTKKEKDDYVHGLSLKLEPRATQSA